MGNIHHWKR